MRVAYATLKANHYSSNTNSPEHAYRQRLHDELGYDDAALLMENPAFINTCATRMSLALIKSGVSLRGRLPIKKGPHQGKSVEPGAKQLADQLMSPQLLGKPQIFKGSDATKGLAGKKGIVFFWKVNQVGGDHIDLIEATSTSQVCHSNCYFQAREVWFWELP